MIYILGWSILFASFFLTALSKYKSSLFLYLSLICFFLIAFLRGSVGTDTAAYEIILDEISRGLIWTGMEPGFLILSWILVSITGLSSISVRAISVLIFLGMSVYIYKSNKNEKYILIAYILPAYVYPYSMNVLRVGIASILLLLAVQSLRIKKIKIALLLMATALMFHYSSLFSIIIILACQIQWFKVSNLWKFLVLILVTSCVLALNSGYFFTKLDAYQSLISPEAYSGLGKLIVMLVLLVGISLSNLPSSEKAKILLIGFFSTLVFWIISNISYAGLRFLDLLTFAFPLCILLVYSKNKLDFGKCIKASLFIAGILSVLMTYRNFLLEAGQGPSPFLPYVFS
ncbi:EpsG family protein [Pseudomonas marginalis]|uniref:EpsG family protein n=1 Tax=Pseudomonas marginalis TaxID=298 RepID=UPI0009EDC98F|nr:EpsG family protein [Pseudomonas marginalis]